MTWDLSQSPTANAARVLPGLARQYLRAGRIAAEPGASWEQMHDFRLVSKRFRYSLEIFRELYDSGIDDRIAALRRVQSVLGDGNDCETTLSLAGVAGHAGFEAWLRHRQHRLEQEFQRVWREEFDGKGDDHWAGYLAAPAKIAR
ncbi:MAG: CHAD domain-containing protein [Bryobacteraceae bacterium]